MIGSRQDVVYRQTPRENNDVNSAWMCDYGRLNFHYLHDERRLTTPLVRHAAVDWRQAFAKAAALLRGSRVKKSPSSPADALPTRSFT